jgi:hypothetical protein
MDGQVRIWPFLYTRTREVDYGFVVLPEPLAQDHSAALALERALEQPALDEGVDVALPNGTTRLYARAEAAELDGVPVKDKVGREIRSLSGFLASAPLAPRDVDKAFAGITKSFHGLRELLWGQKRRAPMLSWPQLAGAWQPKTMATLNAKAPASPPTPEAERPRAGTRLPPPPTAPRQRHSAFRSWRLAMEATLCVFALGLLGTVHHLVQASTVQRAEIKRLKEPRPPAPSCTAARPPPPADFSLRRAVPGERPH